METTHHFYVQKKKYFLNLVALEFAQVKKKNVCWILLFFLLLSAEIGSWFLFEHEHYTMRDLLGNLFDLPLTNKK